MGIQVSEPDEYGPVSLTLGEGHQLIYFSGRTALPSGGQTKP